MWKATLKAQCVLWFLEDGKPTSVQKKFRKKYGRNARSPDVKSIKIWAEKFKTTGSCHQRKKSPRKPKFDRTAILKQAEENPRQSLRRRANHLKMSHSTVRRVLKSSSYRPYHPQVVQALNRDDYSKRLSFANWGLEKLEGSPRLIEFLLFSDEAIFHLEGGVNKRNATHWATENPNWTIEKSLNSPKVMVWGAFGYPGIIGPFFFDGTVTAESYLAMITEDFLPAFKNLPDSDQILFMQDGAPPHWSKIVRDWMNTNLPQRWIGRGSDDDENIPWPPRSPDLTPMDFFLWGYIKSKVYVRNYATLEDLKASITAAFQDVSREMIHATMLSFVNRLKKVVKVKGGHVEK